MLLVCLALFSGCATVPPSASDIASIGYGAPLTIDWQAAIKQWFLGYLKDPLTAQYIFAHPPQQGWARKPPIEGSQLLLGYAVLVRVNAKNSYGAYIGFQPYLFIFRNNQIVYVFGPQMGETQRYIEAGN